MFTHTHLTLLHLLGGGGGGLCCFFSFAKRGRESKREREGGGERERERESEREQQRERESDREREQQSERESNREREREKQTEREKGGGVGGRGLSGFYQSTSKRIHAQPDTPEAESYPTSYCCIKGGRQGSELKHLLENNNLSHLSPHVQIPAERQQTVNGSVLFHSRKTVQSLRKTGPDMLTGKKKEEIFTC